LVKSCCDITIIKKGTCCHCGRRFKDYGIEITNCGVVLTQKKFVICGSCVNTIGIKINDKREMNEDD